MSHKFRVYILGSSAAIPTSLRHTTLQVVNYHNKYFLLDCAEGAQMQLRRFKLPMMRIDHIFISHLHGDHYLGLPGLIFTLHLLGRKRKLHVYSPPGLKEIIEFQYSLSKLSPGFDIQYHIITQNNQKLYEDNQLKIESIEMQHSIETYGFFIKEKINAFNIRREAIEKYSLTIDQIQSIKSGKSLLLPSGEEIPNEQLTYAPPSPRSYAFGSDTGYTESFIEQIYGANLLYHEATFLQDKVTIAEEKTHSTARQAATIALKANVKQLIMGHYSARYDELDEFETEARSVFPNSMLAEEGMIIEINDEDNVLIDSEK